MMVDPVPRFVSPCSLTRHHGQLNDLVRGNANHSLVAHTPARSLITGQQGILTREGGEAHVLSSLADKTKTISTYRSWYPRDRRDGTASQTQVTSNSWLVSRAKVFRILRVGQWAAKMAAET